MSTAKLSSSEVDWEVFRSSGGSPGGSPGGYLIAPGCALMTTGCFLRYFNSRCSWHQEHHTQKQDVRMSLQKEPCTQRFSRKWNEKFQIISPSSLHVFYLDAVFLPGGSPHGEEGGRDGDWHPAGAQDGRAENVTQWKTVVGSSHPWDAAGQARAAPEAIAAWGKKPRVQQTLHTHRGINGWTNPHKYCSYQSRKRGRCSTRSLVGWPWPVRDQTGQKNHLPNFRTSSKLVYSNYSRCYYYYYYFIVALQGRYGNNNLK